MAVLRGTFLILLQAILLPGTFVVTDTGTYPPESGVFGLLLTLYSISAFVSVYCRWQMVSNHSMGSRTIPHLNNCGLLLGSLAALGTLLVACFQETSQITLHLIGAFLAFILVCGYMWLHAGLTHSVATLPGHSRWLGHLRLGLAAAATVSVVGYDMHVVSAAFEWALAGLVSIYFLTFCLEFRHINVGMPVVTAVPAAKERN
ncbi:hypothetical protein EGW08_015261 [Elysia chlorotica]|uniref:CWH43-like N-terminal domain-containing protein n=1 Tax=Elysia chlorotica TaxID=188477 RepID=A0A433T602_ELYCH|nr:hypothetical protein EGW08_015261 [Elysia chlorotica]